MSFWKSFVDF